MEERSNRRRAPPTSTAPWLLLQQGESYEDQTFYVLSPLPSHVHYARKRIPELRGNMIYGCYYGWLLLRFATQPDELSLFDLVSLRTILLPTLEEEGIDTHPVFTLTAPPDDPNCFVLLFDERRAIFCRPRTDDRWTVQKTFVEHSGKEIEIRNPISCNGVIYAWGFIKNDSGGLSSRFVSIEVIADDQQRAKLLMIIRSLQPELSFVPIPTLRVRRFLVESSGELFAVCYRFNLQDIHRVEVYRLERDIGGRMIWEEVKNLKGRAFFIGFNSNASLRMTSHHESMGGLLLRENSIYFTFNGDEGIYRYGLEDRSLTPFLPCPNLPKLTGDPHVWVVPLPHQSNGFDNRNPEDCKSFIGKGTIQTRVMTNGRQLLEKDLKEGECGAYKSFISSLPLDIIASFARCLALSDYLNFRVVCKRFLKAAPRIDLIASSIVSEDHSDFAPSLLFLDRIDGKLCNLIDLSPDNIHDLYWSSSAPTFFKKATITFSSKGWLILDSHCAVLQSYNPVTRTIVEYPKTSLHGVVWGFSTFPTSPDCVIVGMDCIGVGSKFVYLRHGDEDWNYCDPADKVPFKRSDNTPVYYEGAFYYLDRKGKLGAFELTDDGCTWKIMKEKRPSRKPSRENYLVECDGTLLSVFVGKFGRWVEVFRLHRPTMTWEKVQSLGGYMLFLSRASSFSTPTKSVGMENRIYFLRFLHGSALYYSLDTLKYHSDGTECPVDDFCNSRLLLHSCWIQPTQP